MGVQQPEKAKKHICVGLLAHVDAGKTTLSEAMLYLSGSIRKLGRVDKKDAFLDTYGQERERGITIFSKQARLLAGDTEITLLDTPGHVDFSAEMERVLQVLDAAVLVISGSDGVQGHTRTLWRLLKYYRIPTFVFINKMDQPGTDRAALLQELKAELGEFCIDFGKEAAREELFESIALSDEKALEEFLETGEIERKTIRRLVGERKLFPCFFGSDLKPFGVEELLKGLDECTGRRQYPAEFGARVFKITRDAQGNRLTHMKITGGRLKARDTLSGRGRMMTGTGRKTSAMERFSSGPEIGLSSEESQWEEKVNQIRVYSGEKYETLGEAEAGTVCAVTGLTKTWAGEGLGFEKEALLPELSPSFCHSVLLPRGCDPAVMLPRLKQLEEEDPQLHILWDEHSKEIKVQIMGQVQIEILKNLIEERFGVLVEFGEGTIVYKETIADTVEGIGHFEPLRHYAEVHLLLEPGEPGSGLVLGSDCSVDELELNWQRLVLTHLEEKEHFGVLAGAPITDMKVTLKSGRAHLKHTEGGDFRQATYRALRQGLMQAECILLEPWCEFYLEIPEDTLGRAMSDLDRLFAGFTLEQKGAGTSVLRGTAPMATIRDYPREVIAYTKGRGQLQISMKGYYPCHNTQEVLEKRGYDPLADLDNPSSSVFCAHGAGFVVEWDEVPSYMHLESCLAKDALGKAAWENDKGEVSCGPDSYAGRGQRAGKAKAEPSREPFLGQEEAEEILSRISNANRKENRKKPGYQKSRRGSEVRGSSGRNLPGSSPAGTKGTWQNRNGEASVRTYKPAPKKEEYLLVDGYNVIFAWEELKELAQKSLDGARGKLLDLLCNYQAIKGCSLIAVFDAYRVSGHPTEVLDYHNIHVVYTKEAETADQYIEKFAHENSRRYDVTVATSDGLEQIIIIGEGCRLISSRELKEEMERVSAQALEGFLCAHPEKRLSLKQALPHETRKEMEKLFTTSPKTDK